jgi:dUTP pyrophosphatase
MTERSVNVKVKRLHPDVEIPQYATPGSAAVDLRSMTSGFILPSERAQIPTGLQLEIPEGYVGLVFARSGNAWNHGVCLANGVGVIDSDFRGELKVLLQNNGHAPFEIKKGDRIAQLAIMPVLNTEFIEVDNLGETSRGDGGFGSTGSA